MKKYSNRQKTISFFILDFILISLSSFGAILIKRGRFYLSSEYRLLLIVLLATWFFSALLSKKYRLHKPNTFKQGMQPFLRSFLYLTILLFFGLYILQLFHYSRFILLTTLTIYLFLQVILYSFIYVSKWGLNVEVINGSESELSREIESKEEEFFIDKEGREVKEPLRKKLEETLLKEYPDAFIFSDRSIHLDRLNASSSLLLDTEYSHNVLGILINDVEFIGNVCELNKVQRINRFFTEVNRKLVPGGYFYNVIETLEQRFKKKYAKYPWGFRTLFHFFDFFWTRILPRLPGLKKIYFFLYGKETKVISKSELLGRLLFCGFKMVKSEEIENRLHFIAKKIRRPLKAKDPSFGPVFKQKRIGWNGEIIYTYKFRSMHPYSEFIHESMLENGELNRIGKIENDIRIPHWGKFIRRYWIDELPMLINFLQGDLKLIGLRPLSLSFFSIYPEDLRKERIKYKPGLIPSIYKDMPKTKEEIFKAELEYIRRYKKHPLKTDCVCFFKVIWNILFRGARSG